MSLKKVNRIFVKEDIQSFGENKHKRQAVLGVGGQGVSNRRLLKDCFRGNKECEV